MTPSPDSTDGLHATIMLHRAAGGRVGADRIALLRAIRDAGSISAAARAVGLSYKAAWDAVQVLNNLFDQPLILSTTGGKEGGASPITDAGTAVIAAYEAAGADLAEAIARLEAGLARGPQLQPLIWGPALRTSARNVLRGTVLRVTQGTEEAEVVVRIADGIEIVATVTRTSAATLGLAPGKTAFALIKSSFVILARGDASLRTSARNCLSGVVVNRTDDAITSEVTLELTAGKTLTATLTRTSADALEIVTGTDALALIKASHVMLAVE